jgi:hypothetical protein
MKLHFTKIKLSLINLTLGIIISLAIHSAFAAPDSTPPVGPDGEASLISQFLAKSVTGWNSSATTSANLASMTGSVQMANSLVLEDGTRYVSVANNNLGLGSITGPKAKLEVAGAIKVGALASECTADLAGAMRFNNGTIELCKNNTWDAGGGDTVIFSGEEVDLFWHNSYNVNTAKYFCMENCYDLAIDYRQNSTRKSNVRLWYNNTWRNYSNRPAFESVTCGLN